MLHLLYLWGVPLFCAYSAYNGAVVLWACLDISRFVYDCLSEHNCVRLFLTARRGGSLLVALFSAFTYVGMWYIDFGDCYWGLCGDPGRSQFWGAFLFSAYNLCMDSKMHVGFFVLRGLSK